MRLLVQIVLDTASDIDLSQALEHAQTAARQLESLVETQEQVTTFCDEDEVTVSEVVA
jgi:hypothetical protein